MFIGIDDDGTACGVSDLKNTQKTISDTICNKLKIYPKVLVEKKDGKDVISITVEPSSAPVDLNGRYYLRVGNTNHEVAGRELERFVMRRAGTSWTDSPELGVTMSDLDKGALLRFREKAAESERVDRESLSKSDEALLKKLNLFKDGKLKRSAVLLFHPHPEEVIQGAYVKIGMFDGPEIIHMDEVKGPLMLLPDKVLEILYLKYIIRPISYKGIMRIEIDPYPEDALRESVLNSIMHNEYSSGIPIQIKFRFNSITIYDKGGLPYGWTLDTLVGEHDSVPVNPSIAQVFFRAGMVESFGRGIERILDAYRDNPGFMPEFGNTSSSFKVVLKDITGGMNGTLDVTHGSRGLEESKHADILSNAVALRTLGILSEAECGISDLMSKLDVRTRSNYKSRVINPLIKERLIEMTDPGSPRNTKQKYRITGTGRDALGLPSRPAKS